MTAQFERIIVRVGIGMQRRSATAGCPTSSLHTGVAMAVAVWVAESVHQRAVDLRLRQDKRHGPRVRRSNRGPQPGRRGALVVGAARAIKAGVDDVARGHLDDRIEAHDVGLDAAGPARIGEARAETHNPLTRTHDRRRTSAPRARGAPQTRSGDLIPVRPGGPPTPFDLTSSSKR